MNIVIKSVCNQTKQLQLHVMAIPLSPLLAYHAQHYSHSIYILNLPRGCQLSMLAMIKSKEGSIWLVNGLDHPGKDGPPVGDKIHCHVH